MAKGGKRDGAGRPKGAKSSLTRQREAIATTALVSGLTPLEYMLDRMRDEKEKPQMRFLCAKEAAPYVHPKLSSVEHTGKNPSDVSHLSDEELAAELAALEEINATYERARKRRKVIVKAVKQSQY